jgi:NADPH-dependent curcumin reductase CurA
VCGYISQYNVDGFAKKKDGNPLVRLKELGMPILGKNGSKEGFCFFVAGELSAKQPDALNALRMMSSWMKEGKLKSRESITHGIESCVPAFIGMMKGQNFGKTAVQF